MKLTSSQQQHDRLSSSTSVLEALPDEALELLLLRTSLEDASRLCCASPLLRKQIRALSMWTNLKFITHKMLPRVPGARTGLVSRALLGFFSTHWAGWPRRDVPAVLVCAHQLREPVLKFIAGLGAGGACRIKALELPDPSCAEMAAQRQFHSALIDRGGYFFLSPLIPTFCGAWGASLTQLALGASIVSADDVSALLQGCPGLVLLDMSFVQPAKDTGIAGLLSRVAPATHAALWRLVLPPSCVPAAVAPAGRRAGPWWRVLKQSPPPLIHLIRDACAAFPALADIHVAGIEAYALTYDVPNEESGDRPDPARRVLRVALATGALCAALFSERVARFTAKGFDSHLWTHCPNPLGDCEFCEFGAMLEEEVNGDDNILRGYRAYNRPQPPGAAVRRRPAPPAGRPAQVEVVRDALSGGAGRPEDDEDLWEFLQAAEAAQEAAEAAEAAAAAAEPPGEEDEEDDDGDGMEFVFPWFKAMLESGFPDELLDRLVGEFAVWRRGREGVLQAIGAGAPEPPAVMPAGGAGGAAGEGNAEDGSDEEEDA